MFIFFTRLVTLGAEKGAIHYKCIICININVYCITKKKLVCKKLGRTRQKNVTHKGFNLLTDKEDFFFKQI